MKVFSGSHSGVTAAVQAEVMKREAALESELREMEQTLNRDERKARLAERLSRRKAGNTDANDEDMQVRVLEATANRARHLEVAQVMRTDFQQRASMEVAQARKRSVMQKRLMNRLVMRDVAASSTDSSSDANDGSDYSVGTSSTGSSAVSFVFSDDAASKSKSESEADWESDAATETEELAADETVAKGEGTALSTADASANSSKASRNKSKTARKTVRKSARKTTRKTARKTTMKTARKTKAKSIRKSTKLTKAGVSGKTSKCSIRKVASSTVQRRISVAGDVPIKPLTLTPAIVVTTAACGDSTTKQQKLQIKAEPMFVSARVLSPDTNAYKKEDMALVSSSSNVGVTTIKKKSARSLKLTSVAKSGELKFTGMRMVTGKKSKTGANSPPPYRSDTITLRDVLSEDRLVRQLDAVSLVSDVAAPVHDEEANISTFPPTLRGGRSVIRRPSSITELRRLTPSALSTSEVTSAVGKRATPSVRSQRIVSTWMSSSDSGTASADSDLEM
jgi:hypothetical protein